MKGFYIHITIDGITYLTWTRTQPEAEEICRDVFKETDVMPTVVGQVA